MSSSTSLWRRMQAQIGELLANMIDRRRVTGIEGGGKIRVVSLDPNATYEETIACLRGAVIEPGDDVVCVRIGGKMLAIGAIRTGDNNDPGIVAGDGESPLAARVDHEHLGGGERSIALGPDAVAGMQGGVAIGYMPNAGRLAVAIGWQVGQAEPTGELSVGIGYWAEPTGTHSVAIGREAEATGVNSTAVGYRAQALGARSTAIGDRAVAAGNDIAAISGNQLRVLRSDGAAGVSNLALQDENGTLTNISIRANGRINVGGVWHAPGNISAMFPPNRKVGASPAPLKSYPEDGAGGVTMPADEQIFVYGTSRNGYRPCVSTNFGMGYVKYELTTAL